jgi:hypothetical protein
MALISLTQGMSAIVDDDVAEELLSIKWHVVKMGTPRRPLFYAARNITIAKNTGRLELMHRRIMQAPKGKVIDHINSNTLDNRKENLRVCSQKENMQNLRSGPNRTGFRGVNAISNGGFTANIKSGGTRYLGYFKQAEDAARAYDAAAIETFGQFAKLNFP